MKKIGFILAASILLFSLTSCAIAGEHQQEDTDSVPSVSVETSEDSSSQPLDSEPILSTPPVSSELSSSKAELIGGNNQDSSQQTDTLPISVEINEGNASEPLDSEPILSPPPASSELPSSKVELIGGNNQENSSVEVTVMKMNVQVGNSTFTATLENNAAANAFVDMMKNGPVEIQMSDYSGFEKVGSLGQNLPANNSQTTTHAGDIVLYQGNQIVVFYGSNSWSYTRLGSVDNLSGWEEALGSGDVAITFSLEG